MTTIINKIFDFLPNENKSIVSKYMKLADKVILLGDTLESLTNDELKSKSLELKSRIINDIGDVSLMNKEERRAKIDKVLNANIVPAFALVREASRRVLHMSHFKVQIVGGSILHTGGIAEMRTGEGKTLTATLPVYLNALTGLGVHVVTVNDYLSKRDAVWMGQVYDMLGLTTSVLNHQSSFVYDKEYVSEVKDLSQDEHAYKVDTDSLRAVSRKEAYACDITYGTNNEFGFDFLKDNIGYSLNDIVQRNHYFAIVDEIDSILIDEARTPLIISAPTKNTSDLYKKCAEVANSLVIETDYTVDEKQRAITLTDAGISKAEMLLGVENIYRDEGVVFVHHLETAVKAKALYHREKEYVVQNNEVVIVDEFTGRLQPGRRWSDGIHQAVEAKEGVTIKEESKTMASITFQNYFRFYDKLSGMTGTGKTSEEEFFKVYALPVYTVPTHHSSKRLDRADAIFQTEKGKWMALTKKVKELNQKGQPVLIGTISIEKNEIVSEYLKRSGIKHTVLNAKNHEREGEIIAEAGKKGSVTIATNMAGRGVDIKLGGPNATQGEKEEVLELGGLFVIGTERHEARRIDNQLRGRAGRQGDRGETQFFVSLEDDLMRIFGSDRIKNMMGKFGLPEDEAITSGMVSRALEGAQEKIEGFHFDSRKHTLQYDDVLSKQRTSIYSRRRRILSKDERVLDEFYSSLPTYKEGIFELINEKKIKYGKDAFNHVVSINYLQLIDMLWTDHLDHMDDLRQSVNLRAYGQRDPLVEYKKEALRMFKSLNDTLSTSMVMFIENIDQVFEGIEKFRIEQEEKAKILNVPIQNRVISESASSHDEQVTVTNEEKLGRNEKCPCGNGKKVKNCDCKEYAHLRS